LVGFVEIGMGRRLPKPHGECCIQKDKPSGAAKQAHPIIKYKTVRLTSQLLISAASSDRRLLETAVPWFVDG